MICNLEGKYILLKDLKCSTSNSAFTVPEGTIIIVKQVDKVYSKVYADTLGDWVYWDLPMEFVAK